MRDGAFNIILPTTRPHTQRAVPDAVAYAFFGLCRLSSNSLESAEKMPLAQTMATYASPNSSNPGVWGNGDNTHSAPFTAPGVETRMCFKLAFIASCTAPARAWPKGRSTGSRSLTSPSRWRERRARTPSPCRRATALRLRNLSRCTWATRRSPSMGPRRSRLSDGRRVVNATGLVYHFLGLERRAKKCLWIRLVWCLGVLTRMKERASEVLAW